MSETISSMSLALPVSTSTLAAAVSDASGGSVPASLITDLISNGAGAGAAAGMSFLAANGVDVSAIPSMSPVAAPSEAGAAANPFAVDTSSISNAFASAISSSAASGSDPVPALQSAAQSFFSTIIIPNSGGQSLLSFINNT